jgi:hypothetical protein
LLVFSGCGNPLGTVPAGGTVIYNDQPVAGAHILYTRDNAANEAGPAAFGKTDQDGRYQLRTNQHDGAVPGRYVVVVSKDNSESLNIPDPLPEGTTRTDWLQANNVIPKSVLPLAYGNPLQSPLRTEVTDNPDQNHFEITLEGSPPE